MALNREDFNQSSARNRVVADARRSTFSRRAPNHFLGIMVATAVIMGCLAVFAFIFATRSAFGRNGEEEVQGLTGEVGLYRNDYGIVHISATNDNDAYFGIGYAHAQDRLWQMDFLRRVGRGRLSELFGRRTLEQDIFLRAMRFDSTAKALSRAVSPESRAALQAYANGVNAYLATHQGKLAAEFDALEYEPEPWNIEDCLLLLRLWAWELNSAFTADLVFTAIADNVGRERALQLLPALQYDPYFAPSVLDSILPQKTAINLPNSPSIIDSLGIDAPKNDSEQSTSATTSLSMVNIGSLAQNVKNAANMRGSSLGSNAWAVRSSAYFHPEQDSAQSKFLPKHKHGALLTADSHLALTLPSRWYEAHLSSPTLNVLGHTLPGLPFVIVGRNDRIAWSLVNAMIDDTDFFAERLDSSDLRRYLAPDESGNLVPQKFRIQTDTIKVKDSSDAVIDLRYTKRSCVLSDLPHGLKNFPGLQNAIPWKSRLNSPSILHFISDSVNNSTQTTFENLTKRECITFRWTGQEISDEPLALLRLVKARTWEDVASCMKSFAVPAVNCVVATSEGNVGVMPLGSVPIRSGFLQAHPNLLRKGWEASEDWRGFQSLSAIGSMLNPPSGRVIAANNPLTRSAQSGTATIGGEALHISHLWDVPSRAARIGEYLQQFEHFSVQGMSAMQTDVASHYAMRLLPYALRAFETTANLSAVSPKLQKLTFTEKQALKLLSGWNGTLEATSAAAAVYTVFLERYVCNTLSDDLGEPLYRQFTTATRLPLRAILSLTERYKPDDPLSGSTTSESLWFDSRSTPSVRETRDDIIRKSFSEAVAVLQKLMNPSAADNQDAQSATITPDSVEAWHYGRLHTLTMQHILANGTEWTRLPLRGVVNAQTIPFAGDATTIASGEWTFHRPFAVQSGASMRFVCDVSDTLAYMILPSGNTGEIMTKNYSDQRELWRNGGLLPVPVAREPHASFRNVLRLVPKSTQ